MEKYIFFDGMMKYCDGMWCMCWYDRDRVGYVMDCVGLLYIGWGNICV